MIKVGDIVTISPAHSLAFAGERARVVDIIPEDLSPIKVQLIRKDNLSIFTFGFSPEEITKEDING